MLGNSGAGSIFTEIRMAYDSTKDNKYGPTIQRAGGLSSRIQAFLEDKLQDMDLNEHQYHDNIQGREMYDKAVEKVCHYWLCIAKCVTNSELAMQAYLSRLSRARQDKALKSKETLTPMEVDRFCTLIQNSYPLRKLATEIFITIASGDPPSGTFRQVIAMMETFVKNQGLSAYFIATQYGVLSHSPLLAVADLYRDLQVIAGCAEVYEENMPYSPFFHFLGSQKAELFTPSRFVNLYSFALGYGMTSNPTLGSLSYNTKLVNTYWIAHGRKHSECRGLTAHGQIASEMGFDKHTIDNALKDVPHHISPHTTVGGTEDARTQMLQRLLKPVTTSKVEAQESEQQKQTIYREISLPPEGREDLSVKDELSEILYEGISGM